MSVRSRELGGQPPNPGNSDPDFTANVHFVGKFTRLFYQIIQRLSVGGAGLEFRFRLLIK